MKSQIETSILVHLHILVLVVGENHAYTFIYTRCAANSAQRNNSLLNEREREGDFYNVR